MIAVCCLSGAFAYATVEFTMTGNRGADFNQFRSAAGLVGTGKLFDHDSLAQAERAHHERFVAFGRLPFFPLLFKPIAALPYEWGRWLWWGINLGAVAGFAMVWPFKPRLYYVAFFWSVPVWMLLNYGQDTALFLALAMAGLWLLARQRDMAAGLVLSLCAAKFHLALAIPVLLAANRRWRALAGGVAGGAVILTISFATEGLDWPARLLEASRKPEFNAAIWRMPNLAGLVHNLPLPGVWEVVIAAATLVAVWRIAKTRSLEIGMMAALAAGLLVSHHAQAYDSVLLLPAIFAVLALRSARSMRFWAYALLLPVPYLLLLDARYTEIARPAIVGFPLVLLGLLCRPGRTEGVHACEPRDAGQVTAQHIGGIVNPQVDAR